MALPAEASPPSDNSITREQLEGLARGLAAVAVGFEPSAASFGWYDIAIDTLFQPEAPAKAIADRPTTVPVKFQRTIFGPSGNMEYKPYKLEVTAELSSVEREVWLECAEEWYDRPFKTRLKHLVQRAIAFVRIEESHSRYQKSLR